MHFVYRLLLSLCLIVSGYTSPQIPEPLIKELEDILHEEHIPGMSLAIAYQDGSTRAAGIGLADVTQGTLATENTRFRIGSVSKGFVSLAILQLVEEGKLSLNDSVRRLIPEISFENRWEETDPIRIVHLLEHTTGWDDLHLCEYALEGPTISLQKAFAYNPSSRTSRWQPGTRMAYCNSGPSVAAYIVEKVTGLSFEEYIEKKLFQPIGIKRATYFQPSEDLTTTYYPDGVTPYPYSYIAMRPSGSINASAQDMARYLLFYLNRGYVEGKQIVSSAMIDRMQMPKSTWAAKEGLKMGYGLGNCFSIFDGFVYHGHDGGIDGSLTQLAYLPELGVGYCYSINAMNPKAFSKIGKLLRSHITQNSPKPLPPSLGACPSDTSSYSGWYQLDAPRTEWMHFLERLLGKVYVDCKENKLFLSSLGKQNALYLPVEERQFRYVPSDEAPSPVSTLILLNPNDEGRFIQFDGVMTIRHVPTWLAIFEILIVLFVLLSIVSIFLYAPIWLLGALRKSRRRPLERTMRLWPLIAVLTLVSIALLFGFCSADLISRLGRLTIWSFTLLLLTMLFAGASIVSVISVWRAPKESVHRSVRIYSILVSTALLIATIYLTYWGIIGLRTWA